MPTHLTKLTSMQRGEDGKVCRKADTSLSIAEEDFRPKSTLLRQQIHWVIPLYLISYGALYCAFHYARVCGQPATSSEQFSPWAYQVNFAAAWCFTFSGIQKTLKIIRLLTRDGIRRCFSMKSIYKFFRKLCRSIIQFTRRAKTIDPLAPKSRKSSFKEMFRLDKNFRDIEACHERNAQGRSSAESPSILNRGSSHINQPNQQSSNNAAAANPTMMIDMQSELSIYVASLCVNAIAAVSNIITFVAEKEVCRDTFGVETHLQQWSEWLVVVPLLGYIAVSIESKPALSRQDFVVLFGLWFSVFSGFILIFVHGVGLGFSVFIVVLGTLSLIFCILYYLKINSNFREKATEKVVEPLLGGDPQTDEVERRKQFFKKHRSLDELRKYTKTRQLFQLMSILMPLFPLAYFLRIAGAFDRDQLYVAFLILSIFSKLTFINYVTESQLSTINAIYTMLLSERKANDTRRDFLRYLFHEVRSPLNTMSMGVDLLASDSSVSDDHRSVCGDSATPLGGGFSTKASQDVVKMLNDATSLMSDVLNDVLLIHKLEEGEIALDMQPFLMSQLLSTVMRSVKAECDRKRVVVYIEKAPAAGAAGRAGGGATNPLVNDVVVPKEFTRQGLKNSGGAAGAAASGGVDGPSSRRVPTSDRDNEIVLLGDRPRLEATLRTFLVNAIKSSKSGAEIIVTVSSELKFHGSGSAPLVADKKLYRDLVGNGHGLGMRNSSSGGGGGGGGGGGSDGKPAGDFANCVARLPRPYLRQSSSSQQRLQGLISRAREASASLLSPVPGLATVLPVAGPSGSFFGVQQHGVLHPKSCQVTVVVRDLGKGYTEKEIATMFNPFSHIRTVDEDLDASQPEEHRESGLGVAVAKEIVSMHDGVVVFDTEPGMGSSFGFIIPFEVSKVASSRVAAVPPPLPPPGSRAGSSNNSSYISMMVDVTNNRAVLADGPTPAAGGKGMGYYGGSTRNSPMAARNALLGVDSSSRASSFTTAISRSPVGANKEKEQQALLDRALLMAAASSSDHTTTAGSAVHRPPGTTSSSAFTPVSRSTSAGNVFRSSISVNMSGDSTAAIVSSCPSENRLISLRSMSSQLSFPKRNGVGLAPGRSAGFLFGVSEAAESDDSKLMSTSTASPRNAECVRNDSYGANLSKLGEVKEAEEVPDRVNCSRAFGKLSAAALENQGDACLPETTELAASPSTHESMGGKQRSQSEASVTLRQKLRKLQLEHRERMEAACNSTTRVGNQGSNISLQNQSFAETNSTADATPVSVVNVPSSAVHAALNRSRVCSMTSSRDDNNNSEDVPVGERSSASTMSTHRGAKQGRRHKQPEEKKRRLKVLVVDDTPSNCKMLSMLLQKYKVDSDIAVNGQIAVDLVREKGHLYDMIFMDFMMPVMTGPEASLQIRKALSYPRLIVGITGNALDVDVKTFIRAGADAIITKPMRPKQLETILGYATDFEFMSSNEYFLTVVKLTEDEYAVQMRRRDEV